MPTFEPSRHCRQRQSKWGVSDGLLSAVIRKGRQVARRIEGGEVIVTNRLGSLLAVFKADTGFVLTVIRIEDRGISRR